MLLHTKQDTPFIAFPTRRAQRQGEIRKLTRRVVIIAETKVLEEASELEVALWWMDASQPDPERCGGRQEEAPVMRQHLTWMWVRTRVCVPEGCSQMTEG